MLDRHRSDHPVWISEVKSILKLFPNAIKQSNYALINGFGGSLPTRAPVYLVPKLTIECTDGQQITFTRVHIAVCPRAVSVDLVLNYKMFKLHKIAFDQDANVMGLEGPAGPVQCTYEAYSGCLTKVYSCLTQDASCWKSLSIEERVLIVLSDLSNESISYTIHHKSVLERLPEAVLTEDVDYDDLKRYVVGTIKVLHSFN